MKKRILSTTLFIFLAVFSMAQTADDIIGIWATSDGKSHIEIYKASDGKTYDGKIIWLKEPKDTDGNPKKGLNGKPVLNLVLIQDFVFDDDEWEDGTIYDPQSDKTYYCTIELEDNDEMKLRGSVDPMGWLGRTETWTRVK